MISVCVTTYNGEKFIEEQLGSILKQLGENDELIVSDDDSTDNTIKLIESLNDKRIKVLHHKIDSNISDFQFDKITRNIENALSAATGDFIFLSDQDDIWLGNKVAVCKQHLQDKQLVLHNCKVIDEYGNVTNNSYFQLNHSAKGFCRNVVNSSYLGCCMAFRRSLLQTALPFPKKPVPHDIWLGLLAEWKHQVEMIDEPLILYRRHCGNTSTSGSKSQFTLGTKLLYRYYIVSQLFVRFFKH